MFVHHGTTLAVCLLFSSFVNIFVNALCADKVSVPKEHNAFSQANVNTPNQNIQKVPPNENGESSEPTRSRFNTDENNELRENEDSPGTPISVVASSSKHSLPEAEREVQLSITDEQRQMPCHMISADGHIYVATVCKNQVEVEHFELKHLQRFVLKLCDS